LECCKIGELGDDVEEARTILREGSVVEENLEFKDFVLFLTVVLAELRVDVVEDTVVDALADFFIDNHVVELVAGAFVQSLVPDLLL